MGSSKQPEYVTDRNIYDTVVVKHWKVSTFGTIGQVAEYLGEKYASHVNNVWESLKDGRTTDNTVIAQYGGGKVEVIPKCSRESRHS